LPVSPISNTLLEAGGSKFLKISRRPLPEWRSCTAQSSRPMCFLARNRTGGSVVRCPRHWGRGIRRRASAFAPKRTSTSCTVTCPHLGVKRTCIVALLESAFDPKRTWAAAFNLCVWVVRVWIEQLPAIDFVVGNGLLALRRHQPINELLAEIL